MEYRGVKSLNVCHILLALSKSQIPVILKEKGLYKT